MMGERGEWKPIWMGIYKANALTLESYRHGRVLFAGDAAHLVPIFGVRGANSGIDDADNLAWKLAFVVKGLASESLLDTYSEERVAAAHENLSYGTKSTEFMAPPSFAFDLMRKAVLSLAVKHPQVRSLINPRQTSAISYLDTRLNAASTQDSAFEAGPAPGAVLAECPVTLGAGGESTRRPRHRPAGAALHAPALLRRRRPRGAARPRAQARRRRRAAEDGRAEPHSRAGRRRRPRLGPHRPPVPDVRRGAGNVVPGATRTATCSAAGSTPTPPTWRRRSNTRCARERPRSRRHAHADRHRARPGLHPSLQDDDAARRSQRHALPGPLRPAGDRPHRRRRGGAEARSTPPPKIVAPRGASN